MTKSNMRKSIENLRTALSMELAAIQQYLLHTHVLDDWGLDRLRYHYQPRTETEAIVQVADRDR